TLPLLLLPSRSNRSISQSLYDYPSSSRSFRLFSLSLSSHRPGTIAHSPNREPVGLRYHPKRELDNKV
ncbi:hypothetical protein PMAYCL1PPCAC_32364, partial [Pristionchus mayeri]